jgi:hypothetical protein
MNKFTFFKGMDFIHEIKIEYKPIHILGFRVKTDYTRDEAEDIIRRIIMTNIVNGEPNETIIINMVRTYVHPLTIIRERTTGMHWQSGL